MTKVVAALVIAAASGCSNADVHIVEEMHTDSYYYGGITHPAIDRTTELWISRERLTQSVGHMQVIVDRESEQLTIVNHDDSTFVACSLPFEWTMLLAEETAERLNQYQIQGTCAATEQTREIKGRNCTCHEAESWLLIEDARYYPTDWKSWVTTDLPFDWVSFVDMYRVLLQLANFQSDFIKELAAIEGYPLLVERKMYLKGFARDEIVQVTELSEEDPAPDIYSVPEGYTVKEHLSYGELREL